MPTSQRSKARILGLRRGLSSAPSLLVMGILIVYPMGTLMLQIFFPNVFSMHPNWHFSVATAGRVLTDPVNLQAIVNSFWIGALASIISAALGTVTAFGVKVAGPRTRSVLNAGIWIIFFAPSFMIASGWVILFQTGGILQQLLNLQPNSFSWFFSPAGLILVMGLQYFPFAHFAMYQAIENVGPQLIQAARMLSAKRSTVFFQVWLRLLAPALLAGATIAFAEGFSDFGLASVISPNMNIPLLSYQIYIALTQLPTNFSAAAVLSLLAIVVTSGLLVLQFRWLSRRSYSTVSSASRVGVESVKPRRSWTVGALAIVFVGLVLPFGATFIQSFWKLQFKGFSKGNWTLANYQTAFTSGGAGLQALARTAEYAVIVAVIVMILGLYIGRQLSFEKSRLSQVLNNLTVATIAIPGVVLGVGYVFAWNAWWLTPLHLVIYGTPICLGLAYAAVHLPYAVRLQNSAMAQIPGNLLTAARSFGARNGRVTRAIIVPLVLETVISTFLIAFTGVMFELPAASLLYPNGEPPYSVLIEHLFGDNQWAAGSALTIVGMAVVFGSYLFGNFVLRKVFASRHLQDINAAHSEVAEEPRQTVSGVGARRQELAE
ncbi:ABC transporter permease [Alicyclobacillus sp. ALC3]|uniref:ABC transporter permease n=1 Tax=Alicyclobacillus sp. ALC3 TaxID=2796143 RepID=UPI002379DEB3|nr:iron ABC transporter permease [Alicyclobacillus sp. ALC3]WDL96125.1 iron ABC transporter permease [Alicyclobacillus sp. ALC3]